MKLLLQVENQGYFKNDKDSGGSGEEWQDPHVLPDAFYQQGVSCPFKCYLVICKGSPRLINKGMDYCVGLSMPPLIAWIWQ